MAVAVGRWIRRGWLYLSFIGLAQAWIPLRASERPAMTLGSSNPQRIPDDLFAGLAGVSAGNQSQPLSGEEALQQAQEQRQFTIDQVRALAEQYQRETNDENNDGIYLDAREYQTAMETMGEENALNAALWTSSPSPLSLDQFQSNSTALSPEELHRQVLDEESGYLAQSEDFRKSLRGGPRIWRAMAKPDEEQEKRSFERLHESWEALGDAIRQQEATTTVPRCSTCQSVLAPHEVQRAQQRGSKGLLVCQICHGQQLLVSQSPQYETRTIGPPARRSVLIKRRKVPETIAPEMKVPEPSNTPERKDPLPKKGATWQKMEDPDTGEVFYWNEETDEMRWELE